MARHIFDLERTNRHRLEDRLLQLDASRADGPARQVFLRDGFALLDLPVPGQGEYIETVDCGHLLFINDAGCTVRLEQADESAPAAAPGHDSIDSEFVLQPLGKIDGPGLSLCVYPGLLSPWGQDDEPAVHDDLGRLARQLEQEKIRFFGLDMRGDNIGYLPFASPDWPRGIPVVIDPGAVDRLDDTASGIKRLLEKFRALTGAAPRPPAAPVRQAELYGDLRSLFNAAQDAGQGMGHFWTECVESVRMGRLQSGWDGVPENFKSIPAAAKAYQARLRRQIPAFRRD